MGGDLGHAPRVAGGADAATLATEGDEPLVAAGVTTGSSEAVSQDTATEVGSEIALDPGGDAPTRGILVLGRGKEGLQVVLDDGVERCAGGTTWSVDEPDRPRVPRRLGRWCAPP